MSDRERLRQLLLERSVKRGDFVLASGARLRLSPASADTDGFFAAVYERAA